MADVFVVCVTTFVLIFLSFLFWKWITKRNELLLEERRRARIPVADVRRNRLKRFDFAKQSGKSENLDSFEDVFRSEERPQNETESEVTDQRLSTQDPGLAVELRLREKGSKEIEISKTIKSEIPNPATAEKASNVANVSSVVKHENSRRWVTVRTSDDVIDDTPVTKPLTSLEELKYWNEGFDEFNVSSTPLMRSSKKLEQRPRTIVCHDMKGGYVEDRFVQGFPSSECYRIYHWQYVDIFVYFSHNFVTIPPPSWTNAAHKHGVQVLGTVITEWEDGAKRCAEMFTDQYSYQIIVNQLVQIAKYYGFDGWLVNIENPIQPAQINNLVDFLNQLTSEMHHHIPGSLVIWYDSVTYKGDLEWQNELNPENRVFFDATDGIFLNYGWNEKNLTMSARAVDQRRRYDIYVGVDVFGRDFFGGGGWNTNKATSVIKNHNLSMALFAPGWVYEKYQSSFEVSQNKFWTSIASDCTIHTSECQLPFVTSFCQGYGNRVYKSGQVVHSKPWTHLGAQQIQPSYTNHIYSLGSQNGVFITSMEHSCLDAFNGGGCLLLQGSTKHTQPSSKSVVRLFKTDILLPSTILISFTTKLEPENTMDVALQLHTSTKPTYIMLCPQPEQYSQDSEDNKDNLNEALLQRYGVTRSRQLSSDHLAIAVGQEHYRLFAPLTGDHHSRTHNLCCTDDASETKWCTRYYLLAEKDLKGSRIKEIRLVLMNKTTRHIPEDSGSKQFKLFVGEVKILDAVTLRRHLPLATRLYCREGDITVQGDNNMMKLSLTLSWSYDSNTPWERFEIYHLTSDGSTTFLGLSYVMSFYVSQLSVPKPQKEVKFIVQAVDCSQRKECIERCPIITIHWT